MKALITGATSGIGLDIARYLDSLKIDLILVGRDKEKLARVANEFAVKPKLVVLDLKDLKKVKELYLLTKDDDIDILVNNAGFGLFGEFKDTDLNKEIDMIDVNIKAVHLLTKLFLKDMVKKNKGYILNVASALVLYCGRSGSGFAGGVFLQKAAAGVHPDAQRCRPAAGRSCGQSGRQDSERPGGGFFRFSRLAGVQYC